MKFGLKTLSVFVQATTLLVLASGTAQALNIGGGGRTATKMILGDSIFALSGDIEEFLEADLDETIDSHARSGCQMNGGNIICSERYSVPSQYANASKRGINTAIFNGGGNDFLIGGGCSRPVTLDNCMETLLAIEETIAGLVADMKSDGINNIVFLGYYAAPASPELEPINNYSMDLKAETYPAMGVTFVDTRDEFRGNEDQYITNDGIHPSAAGSRVLADLILEAL